MSLISDDDPGAEKCSFIFAPPAPAGRNQFKAPLPKRYCCDTTNSAKMGSRHRFVLYSTRDRLVVVVVDVERTTELWLIVDYNDSLFLYLFGLSSHSHSFFIVPPAFHPPTIPPHTWPLSRLRQISRGWCAIERKASSTTTPGDKNYRKHPKVHLVAKELVKQYKGQMSSSGSP